MSTTKNIWFIVGASSGFGEAIAREALSRGDAVIACSRKGTSLTDLGNKGALLLDLDVTAPDEALQAALDTAVLRFGHITHFINALGYLLQGPVEAVSASEAADSLHTNVLGVMNLCRLQVAYLRPRAASLGRKVIANFGSVGSWYGGPAWGHYAAAKWAVSGFTEALHEEGKDLGIEATVVEPGYFRTAFLREGGANRKAAARDMRAEYAGTNVEAFMQVLGSVNGKQPGDVVKGAKVIVDVLTGVGVGEGREIPIQLMLGKDCLDDVRGKIERTEKIIKDWENVIVSTDHDDMKK
ncbi:NAD(P)-binding protein [Xylariaceae sp. FL0016]|nr:NAD(P)-binding protein [Xylariaceae sp. FL0016]